MTCINCYKSIQSVPLKDYNQLQNPEDNYKNVDVHDAVHPDCTSCSKRFIQYEKNTKLLDIDINFQLLI